jgi:elongation factor P
MAKFASAAPARRWKRQSPLLVAIVGAASIGSALLAAVRSLPASFVAGGAVIAKPPRGLVARQVGSITVPGDIKRGLKVIIDGVPSEILEFQQKKVGKGVGIVKTKVRQALSGATVEKTLKSGDRLEEFETAWRAATYSYQDVENNAFMFMDSESFEELSLANDIIGESQDWLTEGMNVELEVYEGSVIQFRLKDDIIQEVTATSGTSGNTQLITLANGNKMSGPNYLQVGDKVLISKLNYQISKRL